MTGDSSPAEKNIKNIVTQYQEQEGMPKKHLASQGLRPKFIARRKVFEAS